MDSCEKTFREWARENRLRLENDEQVLPVVVSRSRKRPLDHLYDGFESGIGFHVTRDGKAKITNLVKKVRALGCSIKNRGDFEANFFVPWEKAMEIARLFKFVKGKERGKSFNPR